MDVEANNELFLEVLRASRGEEGLNMVPVIGAGFNKHLFGGPELERFLPFTEWEALLEALGGDVRHMPSLTMKWENLVSSRLESWPRKEGERISSSVVEKSLKREVKRRLSLDDFPEVARQRRDRFLQLGFRDLLILNFDEVMKTPKMFSEPDVWLNNQKTRMRLTHHGHYANPHSGWSSRLWFPHGYYRNQDSYLLGIREYGLQILGLEACRKQHKKREKSEFFHLAVEERHRAIAEKPYHWIDVGMNAPLVFIGSSMGPDEWDLIWFLNTRLRNHSNLAPKLKRRYSSFRLTCLSELDSRKMDDEQYRIHPIGCQPSWEETWDWFYEAMDQAQASVSNMPLGEWLR